MSIKNNDLKFGEQGLWIGGCLMYIVSYVKNNYSFEYLNF